MPPSTAARTIGSAASPPSTHGLSLWLPKLIMPRQMRETRRPVAPTFTYCIGCLLAFLAAGWLPDLLLRPPTGSLVPYASEDDDRPSAQAAGVHGALGIGGPLGRVLGGDA